MFEEQDITNLLDIINSANIKGSSSEYISELKNKVKSLKHVKLTSEVVDETDITPVS